MYVGCVWGEVCSGDGSGGGGGRVVVCPQSCRDGRECFSKQVEKQVSRHLHSHG